MPQDFTYHFLIRRLYNPNDPFIDAYFEVNEFPQDDHRPLSCDQQLNIKESQNLFVVTNPVAPFARRAIIDILAGPTHDIYEYKVHTKFNEKGEAI